MKRTKKTAVCAVCAALMLLSGCGDAAKNVELGSFITEENVQNINFATIYPKEGEYFNYFAVIDDAHTAVISYYETAEYTDFNTFVIYENGKRVYEKQISNRFDSLCYDSENDCFYSHNNSDDNFYRLDREFNITGTVAENIHLFYIKSSYVHNGKLWFNAVTKFPAQDEEERQRELQEMLDNGTFGDYHNNGETMFIVDLKDNSVRKADIPNLICDFCDGENIYCYTCRDSRYELCRLDENGSIVAKTELKDTGYIRSFIIRGNDLLYSTNESLFFTTKDLITGLVTTKEEDICAHDSGDIQMYKGNLICNDRMNRCIIAYGQEKNEPVTAELKHAGETLVLGQIQSEMISLKIKNITKDTGIELTTATYPMEEDELLIKLMAGDSDIDIYFIHSARNIGRNIRRNGIYEDMSGSTVLQNEFSRYFDYLSEYCRNGNDIWCVPIREDQYGTFYIPENMEAAGIAPAELTTFDGYMGALEKAKADSGHICYSNFGIFADAVLHDSYNVNYSYTDYDTELYRHLFRALYDGWDHNKTHGEHPLFNNPYAERDYSRDMEFDTKRIIFKTGIFSDLLPDDNNMDNWRAVPFPRITEDSDKNPAILEYAVINPFGKKKDAALELLEYAAVNNSKYGKYYHSGSSANFFYKDKEDYEGIYDTESPLFDDIYDAYVSGAIWEAAYPSEAEYFVWEYQDGRYSLDDVIEHLEHMTEIARNE